MQYKEITKEDAEIFLKLYKKYLLLKADEMKSILQILPTDVIERCFSGIEFYDKDFDISKLDESDFGIGGLHGYSKIRDVARNLVIYKQYDDKGELDTNLERFGHKVNRKKIGIPKL